MLIIEGAYVPGQSHNPDRWPFSVPCIREVVENGLEFESPITLFVGENGSGKSTLIEALAEAFGFDEVRVGEGALRYAPAQGRSLLGEALKLKPGPAVRELGVRRGCGSFFKSESCLQLLEDGFGEPGLLLLDEPEALSFQSCLDLIKALTKAVRKGSQVICATHSPLLAAIPNADIWEVNDEGISRVAWEDLDMVEHWRRYLDDPARYLRHLLAP